VADLAEKLRPIRSGTVDAGVVASVRVDGRPLRTIARVKPSGDRLMISPFDPSDTPAITRALAAASLSAYAVDPTTVSVSVPPLSTEQRQKIGRHAKQVGEEARVAIRSIRQQARKAIDSGGRGSYKGVQEATDEAVEQIDRLVSQKLNEIDA
jgi:ribosome recycling factor